MLRRRSSRWLQRGLATLTLGGLALGIAPEGPAEAAPWNRQREFASPRFEKVWRDADAAVAEGRTNRSWTWGPGPWFDYKEFYQQSPNGLRQVQYFDKARMEINNPANTSGPLAGVTNGLLPVELVSGRLKLGDGTGPDQNEQREPALLPVAGDPQSENLDAPTYASFRSVATTDNGYKDQNKVGQRVGATIGKDGAISFRQDLAEQRGTDIAVYESVTGHNVPRIFHDFRNAGPIPAIAAFGLPITDAYWVQTKVGGQAKDVLVQLYERRVLTYTPSNAPRYQVEMGNVGQHYFMWRYPHLGSAWNPTTVSAAPLHFASRQLGAELSIFVRNPNNGQNYWVFGDGQKEAVPFSLARSYSGASFVYGDTREFGSKRQLIARQYSNQQVLPISSYSESNDYNAAVSPDGTKIAFISDRDGNPEIFIRPTSSDLLTRLTETEGCINQYPTWLPDGSGLVYESNCLGGNFEIYRAALSYTAETREQVFAKPISPNVATRLTNNNTDDRYPRLSPDGSQIAFTGNRDGNAEIYLMNSDGGQQRRLTNDASVDQAPTWNSEGTDLAFASNRDGDFEIYHLRLSDSNVSRLTDNTVEDNWPIWAK